MKKGKAMASLLELLLVVRRLAGIIAVVVHAPTAIVFVVGHRNE